MSDLLIKYVLVLDNSETWLQMADNIEDLEKKDMFEKPIHIERWFYSRHEKGDSLMFKEKAGDRLPAFLIMAGIRPLKDILQEATHE
jgi:hypothetical protein